MLRSMYAGISGMKNFQTKLDVVANNIANVNTPGFKKGRVVFQDMLSQTVAGAQAPTDTRGGVNPAQVGLGSQLGAIDNIHTQGFRQTTNNPLDLSIQGDGFFAVQDGERTYYTRAGNFYLDHEGYIVTSDGYYLVGENLLTNDINPYDSRIRLPLDNVQSFNITQEGYVEYVDVETGQRERAGRINIMDFANPSGLYKEGGNLYTESPSSGAATVLDLDVSATSIVSNSLEMSNVDLAEEFTEMITAQRGFQANTRIITTSDEILQELVNLKR